MITIRVLVRVQVVRVTEGKVNDTLVQDVVEVLLRSLTSTYGLLLSAKISFVELHLSQWVRTGITKLLFYDYREVGF